MLATPQLLRSYTPFVNFDLFSTQLSFTEKGLNLAWMHGYDKGK